MENVSPEQGVETRYDSLTDTMYVSFSEEPHYGYEIDGVLILEIGIYSHMPTGFCILNWQKHKLSPIKDLQVRLMQELKKEKKKQAEQFDITEQRLGESIQQVLTPA